MRKLLLIILLIYNIMYCVKEKRHTEDIDPVITTTKNGRKMMKARCASCGIMKTQFVKAGGA